MTRIAEAPPCKSIGIVPLPDLKPEDLDPLRTLSRPSMEEIHDKAVAIGANYVVVEPGLEGPPEGKAYYCG